MDGTAFIKEDYSIEDVCRTCSMPYENGFLIPIFKFNSEIEIQVYEILKHFLACQLELVEDDCMPQNICKDCYMKFVDFKIFLDKCIESNNNFLTIYVEKSKNCVETYLNHSIKYNEKIDSKTTYSNNSDPENDYVSEGENLNKGNKADQHLSSNKDHDYQDIGMDIIEENSDTLEDTGNVEILDEETNLVEFDNANPMKIDFISESDIQIIDNENIALLDCSYCNYAFSEDYLEKHLEYYHPVESPFLCTKCFRNFRTLSIRDKHVLLNICQVNEVKLQEFQNNAVEVVAEDEYFEATELESENEYTDPLQNKIDYSDFETNDVPSIDSIEKCSNNDKIGEEKSCEKMALKCPMCDEEFTKTKFFSDHIKRSHPNFDKNSLRSKYACEICDKDCKSKQSLESHLNSHRGVKPYVCDICKTSFYGSKALRTHITNEHSSLQFTCELCGKVFRKKSVYITHMSNHKKDNDPNRKPDIKYKCQFCPRTFNTVSTLTIHSLTHKKLLDSKHICNECGVTFKRADHLKMHMYGVHLDHKPFPCEQCDKSFPTAWQRNTHVKKYHSVEKKKYKCELCPNEYTSSTALKRHMMLHTGELKYNCDVCDQKFSKILLLEEHLKTHEIDENQRQESINEVYNEIAKSVIISN